MYYKSMYYNKVSKFFNKSLINLTLDIIRYGCFLCQPNFTEIHSINVFVTDVAVNNHQN